MSRIPLAWFFKENQAMRTQFRLSDLVPAKLNVEAVHHVPDANLIPV